MTMKNIMFCVGLVMGWNIYAGSVPLPHEKLVYPELNLKIPTVRKEILGNGLKLFYLPDHGLPIVQGTLYVPGGAHRDPEAKAGLSQLLSTVQRAGGSQALKPTQLDSLLEGMGATISAGSSPHYNTLSFKCLRPDLDKVLKQFFDLVMRPRFDKGRFKLEKKNRLEAIRRQDDDPAGLVRRKFNHLVYRPHPQGYEVTMESMQRILLKDLIQERIRRFLPDGSHFLLVGDVKLEELHEMLSPLLEGWEGKALRSSEIPEMKLEFHGERYFVQKGIPQMKIRVGHKSVLISNPDYFPLLIMDYILGGGSFNSRLVQRIRTELGLAYSVYSYVWGDVYYGTMGVDCGTRTAGSVEALSEILSGIREIQKNGISPEELNLARDTLVNQFVFKFSSRYQIASRMVVLEQKGLPEDFLERYLKALKAVSQEDVLRVAGEYYHLEKLKIVLVGDFAKVRKAMQKQFGKFREITLPHYE
jgi:zinc protease